MHKINTAILTRFLFILDSTKVIQSGKTVTYEIRRPNDSVFASGNMNEIGVTGIYKHSWTPNVVGWWIFKISCASPRANEVRAYFVESGLEKDIKTLLEHATYGLSAIETLVDDVETGITQMKGVGFVQATDALSKIRDAIDALNDLSQADILSDATPFAGGDIATIKGYVDEIESLLKNVTYGLSALNAKLIAIQADLDNPNQYKADVSALALEATLGTHDTDIKGLLGTIQTDLDNPNQYKADITGLALEATLTAIKGAGWTTETLKAIYDAMALESTLTAIKGVGWTNETLKAIKDAIDALNDLSTANVWSYGTRTLTDPNSYKADVSALALEATLATHDTDIKALLATVQADLDNPNQYKADVSALALEATLGTHDTDIKALLTTVQADLDNPNQYKADVSALALEATLGTHDTDIKALLEHATYGLSALETLVDEVESLLKNVTYGLSALKDEIDANETKIDTLTTNLGTHDTDIKALLTTVQADLDNPNQYKADVSALALEATLGTHDTDIKAELGHATYGLSAIETLVDEVESLLKNVNYGLDKLARTGADSDTLETLSDQLDTIAGYTDDVESKVDALENKLKANPSVDSILFKSGGAVCPASKSIWDALGDATVSLNTLNDLLTDGTYGLSAIETLVDEVESLLKDATYGLSALETLIDDLESRLTSARAGYLDNLISSETSATYSHPDGVAEEDAVVITPAELTRYFDLYLDLSNLAQITTVKIYVKVDGTNYRLVDSAVFPTDFEADVKCVVIELSPSSKGMKVTLTSAVAEGSAKNVPHFYIKKSEA